MKRGEVWTVSGGAYAGTRLRQGASPWREPRPAVILQDDRFDATASVTLCVFTTDETEAPLFRLVVEPSARNGLRQTSRLMIDKITTAPKERLGDHIGNLDAEDMVRLNRAVLVFLGLA